MEAGERKRDTMVLLLCLIIPAWGLTLQPPENKTCEPWEYLGEKGICCDKCNQGFKLVSECQSSGSRSNCMLCPAGEFTDQMNYSPNCRRCRRCKKFEVMVESCKHDHDTVCVCKDGFYKDLIDSTTSQCLKCTPCGEGERQISKCTAEHNTQCECEPGLYRVKNMCVPCKDCSDCEHECPSPPKVENTKVSKEENDILLKVVCGSIVLVALVLVVLLTYVAIQQHARRSLPLLTSSQSPQADDFSPEYIKVLTHSEEPEDYSCNAAIQQSSAGDPEPSNLPDCVPLEIKMSDLIYTLLDLVPVLRVKQLVRSLGVTDVEIERAEFDHRACNEAHYQMLRVWVERGSQTGGEGQGGMLHLPLLEELLEKLRGMHLGQAADELEAKYGIQ